MDLVTRLLLNSSQFDNNIQRSTGQIRSFQQAGRTAGNALGSMTSMAMKFAGGIGIAMSAGEAFNKAINSTQTSGDAFVKMTDQMKAG